jgi:hypothetical protein
MDAGEIVPRRRSASSKASNSDLFKNNGYLPPKPSEPRYRGIYSELLGKATQSARSEVTRGPTRNNLHFPIAISRASFKSQQKAKVRLKTPVVPLTARSTSVRHSESSSSRLLDTQEATRTSRSDRDRDILSDISFRSARSNSTASQDRDMASDKPKLPRKKQHLVEPAVFISSNPKQSGPPRAIVVERARRVFSSLDLEVLLRAQHVDYSKYGLSHDHISGLPVSLPLPLFDNTEFEPRSLSEWMRRSPDSKGANPCRIPARGLRVWHKKDVRKAPMPPEKEKPSTKAGRKLRVADSPAPSTLVATFRTITEYQSCEVLDWKVDADHSSCGSSNTISSSNGHCHASLLRVRWQVGYRSALDIFIFLFLYLMKFSWYADVRPDLGLIKRVRGRVAASFARSVRG